MSAPANTELDPTFAAMLEYIERLSGGMIASLRWSKYQEVAGLQVLAQHIAAQLQAVAPQIVLEAKQQKPYLDDGLLYISVMTHDNGEALARLRGVDLKKLTQERLAELIDSDTWFEDKSTHSHVDEYALVNEHVSELKPTVETELRRAFLLQFADEQPDNFPQPAQEVMESLWVHKGLECRLFTMIERFGYITYALGKYRRYGCGWILGETLDQQGDALDMITRALKLGEVTISAWTDIRPWCRKRLLANQEHRHPNISADESWLESIQ